MSNLVDFVKGEFPNAYVASSNGNLVVQKGPGHEIGATSNGEGYVRLEPGNVYFDDADGRAASDRHQAMAKRAAQLVREFQTA